MQFNQMNPPFYGYNNCGPQIELNRQIIGEGNVTFLVYPDGSIQHFFLPLTQWCPPMYNNPMNINATWTPNFSAWLVRSINNPQLPPNFCQLSQRPPEVPLQKQLSDFNISKSDVAFKLKFHNDGWTSTTDLVYFYPSLRSPSWLTQTQCRGSAAIQVELPSWTICHCDTVRQPCSCAAKEPKRHSDFKNMGDEAGSSMSIDDISSKYDRDEKKTPKNRKTCCCSVTKSQSTKNICKCSDIPTSKTKNKLVSTFVDQASNCLDKNEQPTQTSQSTSSSTPRKGSKNNRKSELPMPKSSSAKKSIKLEPSEKSLSTCPSDCSCYDSN